MKNVCIVAKKRIAAENGAERFLRAFSSIGYEFGELRILSEVDGESISQTLSSLKNASDNILLLLEKEDTESLRSFVAATFSAETAVRSLDGLSVYQSGQCSLFAITPTANEEYVKSACADYLRRKYGTFYEESVIRAVGADENRIRALIAEGNRISEGKLRILRDKKFCEDVVRIVYDAQTPKMLVAEVLRLFAENLEDTMYALSDTALEEQLVDLLKLRGKKISVAESFTGGGVAKRITSVSGASEVYFEGLNTYAEEAKQKRLGISPYLLKTAGAVSDQTAYDMALGLLNTGDCDIAVATTGLAGPKSDRSALPVGLCYIAVGSKEKIIVYRYTLDGNRQQITEKAINYALFLSYKYLKTL